MPRLGRTHEQPLDITVFKAHELPGGFFAPEGIFLLPEGTIAGLQVRSNGSGEKDAGLVRVDQPFTVLANGSAAAGVWHPDAHAIVAEPVADDLLEELSKSPSRRNFGRQYEAQRSAAGAALGNVALLGRRDLPFTASSVDHAAFTVGVSESTVDIIHALRDIDRGLAPRIF